MFVNSALYYYKSRREVLSFCRSRSPLGKGTGFETDRNQDGSSRTDNEPETETETETEESFSNILRFGGGMICASVFAVQTR